MPDLSDADWIAVARLGLSTDASEPDTLWESLDLDDPDDRRFGDYELLEQIGRGGMGVVFRAFQHSLGRQVAIKFIVGSLADQPQAILRFSAEARSAARLHHPHIVPIYESGQVDGMPFFSMPLLNGQTLAERLEGGGIATPAAVELMIELCTAVSYAHDFGLLHLDLKPGNVLFDSHGQALIGDFGLARQTDAEGGVTAEDVAGTAAYMAPEQIAGGERRLDQRTDLYALGAMLQEMLGYQSAQAEGDRASLTQRTLRKRGAPPVRPNRPIDRDLDAICLKCLAGDPVARYQRVADLTADLTRFRDGNRVSVRAPAWHERLARMISRHPGAAAATGLAVLALTLGLLTTSWQWQRAERARAEASWQRDRATEESLRAQQLAGLMAAAFPSEEMQSDGHSRNAHDAVAWLKLNAPDPAVQRGVLSAFRQALDQADKGAAVTALMAEIIDQLGEDYREQQVARLAAKGDRDSLIAAALIGIPRGESRSSIAHAAVLQHLVRAFPDDPLANYAATLACHVQPLPCDHADFFKQLIERFPKNAVNFMLVPSGAPADDAGLVKRILLAASAADFNDQLAALTLVVRNALHDQPLPQSILQPMQAVVSASEVAPSLRRNALDRVPLPKYADLLRACKPDSSAMTQSIGLHQACTALATHGMHADAASVLARMVSSAILRRLHKGEPLALEAWEYRRQYVWLSQHADRNPAAINRLERDIAEFGEWEALQREVERAGFARTPPPKWLPANPQLLLLSEDRRAPAGAP